MATVDDVFESWEDMEASGALDRKLNDLQINPLEELNDETSRLTSTNGSGTRMIILGDDALRSQYVPPKPTVKILKRPSRNSQGSGDGPLLNGEKPKQPIKSLKQREQEYAEARKRILGEEKSPEEKILQDVSKIQPKPSVSVLGANESSNVIRMPLGPDGTKGFNVRR
ncbi:SUZ domain-containing protein 1 [Leptopilina heterotoma]|uniref:SUZ domain-containing protein 1 n=1 Tax=Leptopilina heterotoma TaxID=63436 RepID=UPI001CA92AB6|nr:SUZ domain-containing protein 1 [Leptopilina heterotoma]